MGDEVVLYHNPRCSKSRGAAALLDERGVDYETVRYLETPPSRADLERILGAIDDPPAALVRTDDARFRELGLDASDYEDRSAVVEVLLAHPELMQRPVVFRGERAVIGRPPERLSQLWGGS